MGKLDNKVVIGVNDCRVNRPVDSAGTKIKLKAVENTVKPGLFRPTTHKFNLIKILMMLDIVLTFTQ